MLDTVWILSVKDNEGWTEDSFVCRTKEKARSLWIDAIEEEVKYTLGGQTQETLDNALAWASAIRNALAEENWQLALDIFHDELSKKTISIYEKKLID